MSERDWRTHLQGLDAPAGLWLDRGPLPGPAPQPALSTAALPNGSTRQLADLAAAGGPSPRGALEGLWCLLQLRHHDGEGELLCGAAAPSGGWLPLRVRLEGAAGVPLRNWLARLERQRLALEALGAVPALATLRAWSGLPEGAAFLETGVSLGAGPDGEPLPLHLRVDPATGALELARDPRRFEAWTAERLLERYGLALEALLADPARPADELDLAAPAERERLLVEWNRTAVEHRPEATVAGLFAEQVARDGSAVAVVEGERQVTYAELDRLSSQLAWRLQRLGVGPDVAVALMLERSVDTLVALLGVLKAGGCYLALEPVYPRERLAFMLQDASTPVVLTHARLAGLLPEHGGVTLLLDEEREALASEPAGAPTSAATAAHLAYIAYTSGSTGTPKGAEITQRAVNRLVRAVDYVELGPQQALLHAAPLAFDASTFEIWGALLNGGRCVLHSEPVPTPAGLADSIRRHGVTTLWLTAALFNAVVDEDPGCLAGARQVLTGGEALSPTHVRRAQKALPDVQLFNGYGPTECTTFTAVLRIPRPFDPEARSVPIGRPIRDTRVYVLDPRRRPVPLGVAGELLVGGAGLARGYRQRPELTAERFVEDPFHPGQRLYRTGDLVRWRPDGTLDYVGRLDTQLKVRGFRIEPGEIEAALLGHAGVKAAVVTARPAPDGEKRLLGWVVAREGAQPTSSELRSWLEERLPPYMVPSALVFLPALPVTGNGKVDQRALPEPASERPELREPYVAPRSEHEAALCQVFAEVLGLDRVGALDNFFELGGSSLLALRALARLRQRGLELHAVRFFQQPTAEALARVLDGGDADAALRARLLEEARRRSPQGALEPVAVVGLAGRFPGAADVPELWRNLVEGRDSVRHFAPAELDPALDPALTGDTDYVRARGVLEQVECFDAPFFGISPREATVMDPQQRLFLEACWEALESAGCVPAEFAGRVGVFGGMYNATYFQRHVATRPDLIEQVGEFQVMVANEKDYVTTRVAHRLGLDGPAISIHTACSTSLVAICQAFDSLRGHHCDLALAGGVAVTCPPRSGYLYQEGGMLSRDGRTRTFDAQATGTVFSDGLAVVALRRLSDALRDGNTIHAVLLGAAVNNDGGDRASFTAPSVQGQAGVVAAAHAVAGVEPRSIGYVETHGTATPLGDPIEVEALTQAFRARTEDKGFCALGSLKSNVGHMVIAAGAGGLIKAALSLREGVIPASLHYEAPNPKIDFAGSPFYVADRKLPWPRGPQPRRAGVSAFGVGGTNAHVVLEEPPLPAPLPPAEGPQLLVLSARTPEALERATERLAAHLETHPEQALADVAFTLQAGRQAFQQRRTLVARDAAEAAAVLRSREAGRVATRQAAAHPPGVAFVFPGQGSQHLGMGAALYAAQPVFRAALDECNALLRRELGEDLLARIHPRDGEGDESALRATRLAQPAIFAVEYALARQWLHWGVVPQALAGHSVGEFVAATLAGVFELPDALRLVAARGALMQRQPEGAMLSVRLAASELQPELGAELALAAVNAPGLCVAAGPHAAVERLEARLGERGVACRRLVTSHAFHSPMMDPAVEPFAELLRGLKLRAPRIPIVSTATGDWLSAPQATDPGYWARHLRDTVRFADALAELWREPGRVLLEVGPRATLTALARQQAPERGRLAVASLGEAGEDEAAVLSAAGQLWSAGVRLDWRALHDGPRRLLDLPTYPFERLRFWIDPARPAHPAEPTRPAVAAPSAPAEASPVSEAPMSETTPAVPPRRERLVPELAVLFEEVAGVEIGPADQEASFLELGLDSLTLTQVAQRLQKTFGVKVTFRQLMENHSSLLALASHLDGVLPAEALPAPAPSAPPPAASPVPVAPQAAAVAAAPAVRASLPLPGPAGSLQAVIDQQLELMRQQLALLSGAGLPAPAPSPVAVAAPAPVRPAPAAPAPATATATAAPPAPATPAAEEPAGMIRYDVKKAFGAIARIHTGHEALTPRQQARLSAFVKRYTTRTRGSKELTQRSRRRHADPRAVSGFKPALKELVYPIVVQRSKGPNLWDVDGNQYVDVLNGFGCNHFGWQPDFVSEAVKRQIDTGIEIGPQTPLALEVAELFCEYTGNERVAFCNTGSEAVMGAMRVARTVTGRSTIALFTGSYHGIFDEVIVRGTKKLKAHPAAPGILPETASNVLVLDYGTDESLQILRERASDLAAILVEPVQSRRPDFQPREFLQELRRLTEQSGCLLIFDEVITGFRTAPGGAQEHFGIRADLASYGKVVGGGYPIGVIAGKGPYMDALDGGFWQYGDDSTPTVGVTYFAGTFVRHPLALAAMKAVLLHLKEQGPELQRRLNARTAELAAAVNRDLQAAGAPLEVRHFSTLFKPFWKEELPLGELFFYMLRDRGLHIYDGFPCFLTTAHEPADTAFVVQAFRECVGEMQESGFMPGGRPSAAVDSSQPPVPGARLGRDENGDPAWFVPNPDQPGKYMKVTS